MGQNIIKIACISKFRSRWNEHLKTRFELAGYELHFVYIDAVCAEVGLRFLANKKMLDELIKKIDLINPKFVIYDLEFVPALFPHEIIQISQKTRTIPVGLVLDDDSLQETNKYLYSTVDKILCNSPQSAKNYSAYEKDALCILPFEMPSKNIIPEMNIHLKKNHVLIYGDLKKADRMSKINTLKRDGVPICILEPGLSYEEVYSGINQAKIVLNFSKSDGIENNLLRYCPRSFIDRILKKSLRFNYQAKGRIFEATYLNSICVSEDFPMHECLLSSRAMPIFCSDQEMVAIIKRLLGDKEYLNATANSMQAEMLAQYPVKKISFLLRSFLEKEVLQGASPSPPPSPLPFTLVMAVIINKASYLRNPLVCIECGLKRVVQSPFRLLNTVILTVCSLALLAMNGFVYSVQRLTKISNAS